MLTDQEKQKFIDESVLPNFRHLIDSNIYSVIFDFNYKIVIGTNLSVISVGCNTLEEMQGWSFANYANEELAQQIFGEHYTPQSQEYIHQYAEKIFRVQQRVFNEKSVISFLDLLPYDGLLKFYIVMYVPVLHPSGEVVAIQSFATRTKLFSHQDYFNQLSYNQQPIMETLPSLTFREQEIMFLLAYGFTQEEMSQILKVHRSTIASIIATQLSVKFGLAGGNTKALSQKAVQHNYHKTIPSSLYRPHIIVLNEDIKDM